MVTYFGDPDLAVSDEAADTVDPVLEVVYLRPVAIPVDGNKVNVAALESSQEILEPAVAATGDSRGTNASAAGKGLHVLPPGVDGILGGHVGLVRAIGLVEAKEVGSAMSQPLVGVVVPLVGVVV